MPARADGEDARRLPGGHVHAGRRGALHLVAQQLSAFLDVASGALAEDPEGMRNLATNLSRLTGTLAGVLSDNRGDLKTLTGDLTAAAKDLRMLAKVTREAMQPGGTGARLLGDAA
ncbi:MAG TPA: MCE family protein, partial [Archangium sp.]|nr:MCE family protein [Archangium sp.]